MDEDDAIRERIQAHVDERKDAGDAIAKTVAAISVRAGVLTVTLDPDAAATTAEAALGDADEAAIARLLAAPALGASEGAVALRARLQRIAVVLADGSDVARVDLAALQADVDGG